MSSPIILNIGGSKVEIDRYKDCPLCGKTDGCSWQGVAHAPACDDCLASPDYQAKQRQKYQDDHKYKGLNDALAVNQPAAVFTHKNRYLYTNSKGDIIKDESARQFNAEHGSNPR